MKLNRTKNPGFVAFSANLAHVGDKSDTPTVRQGCQTGTKSDKTSYFITEIKHVGTFWLTETGLFLSILAQISTTQTPVQSEAGGDITT